MLQAFSGAPGVFDDLETVPKGNLLLKIFFLYDTVVTRFPVQLILGTYTNLRQSYTNTRFFDQRSIKLTLAPQFPAKFTSPWKLKATIYQGSQASKHFNVQFIMVQILISM